jgi:hypothetical protein
MVSLLMMDFPWRSPLMHTCCSRNMEDLSVWSADDVVSERYTITSAKGTGTSESTSAASSTAVLATATEGQPSADKQTSEHVESSTLSSPAVVALYERLRDRVSPEAIRSGDRIPPELLLNGARAIGAFCRPYPTAMVGTPRTMTFDIRTSRFEMEVEVDSRTPTNTTTWTELYVPFVHYARDSDAMSVDAAGTRGRDGPVQAKVHHDAKNGLSQQSSGGQELEISVKINEGRYELHGQYLRWYYESPTAGTKVMRLSLRRKNGPIAARLEQSIPSWGDLCPVGKESCTIM